MEGFIRFARAHARDLRLSPRARLLLAILKDHDFRKQPAGQEELAQALGCCVRMVRQYTRELEAAGLIAVWRQGRGHPNLYEFLTGTDRQHDRQSTAGTDRQPIAGHVADDRQPIAGHVADDRQPIAGPIRDEVLEIKKEKSPPPPEGEKSADDRIDFFKGLELVADRGQTESFLKNCERLASYRGWKRAGDPQMFTDHWWRKFKRYPDPEFAAAVDAFIESADVPYDRPGVATWLHKWIDKQRRQTARTKNQEPNSKPEKPEIAPRWTLEQRQELIKRGLLSPEKGKSS